jgi:sulfoxide reductase heme-binding subunit YedZ
MQRQSWLKVGVFWLALTPLAWLIWAAFFDQLGANPAQALVRATGDWTLRMLCLVLAITPLRSVFHIPALARLRRMLGLFMFFYAVLHLLSYSAFDMGFDFFEIGHDIVKRPFILLGFTAFLITTCLAATSFNSAIKIIGGKNWKRLHQLVYVVAILALLHFYWMRAAKSDFLDVLVYASIIGLLLGWRLLRWTREWVQCRSAERPAERSANTVGLVAHKQSK